MYVIFFFLVLDLCHDISKNKKGTTCKTWVFLHVVFLQLAFVGKIPEYLLVAPLYHSRQTFSNTPSNWISLNCSLELLPFAWHDPLKTKLPFLFRIEYLKRGICLVHQSQRKESDTWKIMMVSWNHYCISPIDRRVAHTTWGYFHREASHHEKSQNWIPPWNLFGKKSFLLKLGFFLLKQHEEDETWHFTSWQTQLADSSHVFYHSWGNGVLFSFNIGSRRKLSNNWKLPSALAWDS